MSLEVAIAENTAAIKALIAAISNGIPTTPAQVAAVVQEAKPEPTATATATAKVEEPAQELAGGKTPAQAVEALDGHANKAKAAATYDDVAALITATAKKDRPAVVAVLGEFGAKTGRELKPEQYDAFVARINERVGG